MAGKRLLSMALRAAHVGQPSLTMPTTAALTVGASSSRKSLIVARYAVPTALRHLANGGPGRKFSAGIYRAGDRRTASSAVSSKDSLLFILIIEYARNGVS